MSKKKKAPPATPPTIISITLNPDGKGTLITKRGDLATVNSFSFKTMDDIIAAMKQGAAHLVEFEKNPPPKDSPTATPAPQVSNTSAARPETTASTEDAASDESTKPTSTAEESTVEASTADDSNTASPAQTTTPTTNQLSGVTTPASGQLSLF